mgnify:CR=1 FL=1
MEELDEAFVTEGIEFPFKARVVDGVHRLTAFQNRNKQVVTAGLSIPIPTVRNIWVCWNCWWFFCLLYFRINPF